MMLGVVGLACSKECISFYNVCRLREVEEELGDELKAGDGGGGEWGWECAG